jgi:hypothetical protein
LFVSLKDRTIVGNDPLFCFPQRGSVDLNQVRGGLAGDVRHGRINFLYGRRQRFFSARISR